jgi:O-antigen ligase
MPATSLQVVFFTTLVLVSFIWGFCVLSRDVEKGWQIPRSPVLGITGAFFLLVICSLFWSEVKPVTLLSICQFSVFPLTFLILAVRPDEKMFRTVAYALAFVFFGLGLWAIVQFYFFYDYYRGQAQHPLQDPSSLGALFSLALFASVGWMLTNVPKAHKIFALILSSVLIGGIYATAARGPVFALVPALLIMVALLWPNVKKAKGYMWSLLAAFIFVPLFMHYTGNVLGLEMFKRLSETLMLEMRGGDISNMRTYLWGSAWEVIKAHPFLGTGYGTFYLYLAEVMDDRYPASAFHAHSDPLQIWADVGFMGIVLLYALFIAAFVRTLRALKKMGADHDNQTRIVIVTTFCALLAMAVHAHVTFNLYNPAIIMPSAFLLAVWFYATAKILQDKTTHLSMPATVSTSVNKIAIALPFLMLGFIFFQNIAGEYYANKALSNLYDHEMLEFADNINKAGKMSNDMNYRSYLLAVNVPITLLQLDQGYKTRDERRKLYEQGMRYMNRVISINPRSDSAYYYMAQLQELAGADAVPEGAEDIEHLYKEAMRLNPLHLGARIALYNRYKAEGRPKEELYAFMESVAEKNVTSPIVVEYRKTLAKMYADHGDYIKEKAALEEIDNYYKRMGFAVPSRPKGMLETLITFDQLEPPAQGSFPQAPTAVPETSGKTGAGL